jgi:RimJ/RimL family protein N-acetyltransferase
MLARAVIRELTANDIPRVDEIALATFGGHDWISLAMRELWLTDPHTYSPLCLEVDGVVASLVVLRRAGPTVGCVEGLRVAGEFRGKGLAHAMLAACVAHARTLPGLETLRYTTYNRNAKSLAVAQKQGFAPVRQFPYVMLSDHSVGEDTSFFTFASLTLREYRARLEAVRAAGSKRASAATPTRDAALVSEALRRSGQTTILQDWKPVDVPDVAGLFIEGEHLALVGAHGVSIGKTRADGVGNICLFSYYAFDPESPNLGEFAAHAWYWLGAVMELGKDSSVWFMYPTQLLGQLVSSHLAAEDQTTEVMLELAV